MKQVNRLALIGSLLIFLVACDLDLNTLLPTPSDQPNTNFSVTTLDFGASQSSTTVTLSNTGNASSTWSSLGFTENSTNPEALPESFQVDLSPTEGTIAAGETQTITIRIDRNALALEESKLELQVQDGSYQLELRFNVDGVQKTLDLTFLISSNSPNPTPTPSGDYKIQLDFSDSSDFTDTIKAVFEKAAAVWAEAITGDLPDVNPEDVSFIPENSCGFTHSAITTVVDDLIIFVNAKPLDGVNGRLAQAGPISVSGPLADRLPFMGCMTFDSEDIVALAEKGTLENTVIHEMGHVLGIGTRWEDFSTGSCAVPTQSGSPTFTGSNAVAEFTTLKGGTASGNVPIEDEGGPGTACGHWDEETFSTELMTGFLNSSADPLSRLTIASLKDLGYEVDLSKAEPYSIPPCSPNCIRSASHRGAWEEVRIYRIP